MRATPAVPYTTLETYNASVLSPLLPRVAHSPLPWATARRGALLEVADKMAELVTLIQEQHS